MSSVADFVPLAPSLKVGLMCFPRTITRLDVAAMLTRNRTQGSSGGRDLWQCAAFWRRLADSQRLEIAAILERTGPVYLLYRF